MGPRKTSKATPRTKADLETEIEQLKAQISSSNRMDPKSVEVLKTKETEVRKSVEGISVDKTIADISKVSLDISRALSAVSEQLVGKVQELETVSQAIEFEKSRLEELHGKDVVASGIQALLYDYDGKCVDLTEKIAAEKAAWAKEQANHALAVKERDAELAKARERERIDYEYTTSQKRKEEDNRFAEILRASERASKEKQEALEKNWALREEELAKRENELTDLRQKVNDFPAQLKAEVGREVAIVSNTLKKDFQHEKEMLKKDADAALALMTQEVKSLRTANTDQVATIAALQRELADAKSQVAAIANKALDSASGAFALDKLQSFAKNTENNGRSKA